MMHIPMLPVAFILLLQLFTFRCCEHAGGPVKESTIINYLKEVVQPYIPYNLPSIEIDISNGFKLNMSNGVITSLNFNTATVRLTKPNTVLFDLSGLTGDGTFDWIVINSSGTNTGTAQLVISNCKGTITAVVEPDQFKNVAATTVVGALTFQSSNQPVIQPYWEILQPLLVDTLQREIPNLILSIDTSEIKSLVYPIVRGLEPIHIPDVNVTVLGVYGGLSNLLLNGIDFESATMGRGVADNEIVFELTQLSALITNDWEFRALGIDKKGSGHIMLNQTTVSVTVGVGEDSSGEFTVNLDTSKLSIGGLEIHVDGGDSGIVDWFLQEIQPILIDTLQASFQVVVCLLFDGIPSFVLELQ
eukprot:TRINITY_DN4950_c0_g4_i4.p1 TRINITY_DN4950_c0_g4~~TRINITY_DN4950_c0_g4_i4.p1  ORF type:complete len:360 (-),score=72.01 TRINITY_DN4950_c0_g4_i4:29-1108(-)